MLMKDRCFDKKMLLSGFMHGGLFSVKNNCLGIKFMKNDEIWIGLSWRNFKKGSKILQSKKIYTPYLYLGKNG